MNTGTNATVTLGAADADEYVTAFDIDGAQTWHMLQVLHLQQKLFLSSADTLDLTFAGDWCYLYSR